VVCRGYELLNKSNNDGSDIFFLAIHVIRLFDPPRFLCSGFVGSLGINSDSMKLICTSISY